MELAQDRVQWQGLVSTVLNLLVSKTGCEVGRWMELVQDRGQWWNLVLVVLRRRVLLQEY